MGAAVEGLVREAVAFLSELLGTTWRPWDHSGSLLMGRHQHDEVHAGERFHQSWSVEERLGSQVGSLISSGVLCIASHEEERCHLEAGGETRK